MQKNIYRLSVILVLFQSHAAEYQFVSASPRLAGPERTKLGSVAVVATGEPAHYGFQKSPTDGSAAYRPLRVEGVDAVLETAVQDIRLQRTGSRDRSRVFT